MPGADRGAKEFSKEFRTLWGTDDCNRRRIEMPVNLHDRLATKAARAESQDDALDRVHLLASIPGEPKSRWLFR